MREGKRDEHGMEEVDGLFSSPEKSPVKTNAFGMNDNEDSIGSDGMSMDEGTLKSYLAELRIKCTDDTRQWTQPSRLSQ